MFAKEGRCRVSPLTHLASLGCPLPHPVGEGALCQLSKPFKPAAAVIQECIKMDIIPGRIDQLLRVDQSLVAWRRRAASQNQRKERHAQDGSPSAGYVEISHGLFPYVISLLIRNYRNGRTIAVRYTVTPAPRTMRYE